MLILISFTNAFLWQISTERFNHHRGKPPVSCYNFNCATAAPSSRTLRLKLFRQILCLFKVFTTYTTRGWINHSAAPAPECVWKTLSIRYTLKEIIYFTVCTLKGMIYPKGHDIPQRAWYTLKGMIYSEGHDIPQRAWYTLKGMIYPKGHDIPWRTWPGRFTRMKGAYQKGTMHHALPGIADYAD